MWHNMRNCDCLQGPAAPQARPGPLGRRVSQVGLKSVFLFRCTKHGKASVPSTDKRRNMTQGEEL